MDLFIILGLDHGASEADIRRAYRRLARRFHPDINPGDHAAELRFREILEAYETLIDPERRSRYEAGQPVAPEPEPKAAGFEGFDFSRRGSDHAVTFGDLFGEVLRERGGGQAAAERGADLHHEVRLTFDESFTGVTCPLTVTRRETCRTCAGSGRSRAAGGSCLVCEGAGSTRSVRGHMVFSRRCTACGGSGQQRPRACEPCGGTGLETRTETVHVRVPAGIAHGETVRVEGRGNAGVRGGPAGDLYLAVQVTPHGVFRRERDDLHCVVDVGIHEAALGARLAIPGLDGPVRLRVPPGTQSGHRLRVSDRGMPSARGGERGDLIAEVRLRLPEVLDERSKELLREFGRINGEAVRPSADGDERAGIEQQGRMTEGIEPRT
jgi:molecular chaperone DnaJ